MTKAYSIFLTVLFTVFIGGVLVISALLPKEEFSEMENRFLQKPPELSIETVKNGKFMENAEKYVSDHIAGRDLWVAAKAWGERLSGKQENNGVYFGKQDTLLNRVDTPAWEDTPAQAGVSAKQGLLTRLGFVDTLAGNVSVPVYLGIIPSSGAPTAGEAAIIETLYSRTAARTVDLLSVLSAHSGEELYYRTDHHWTSLGAFYGANAIFEAMSLERVDLADYERTTVTDQFYGTIFSASGVRWVAPDRIDTYIPADGVKVTSYFDGTPSQGSLYVDSYLEVKDKYSYFLGGVQPLCVVETGLTDAPRLLLIRDSYSDSLTPFLTQSFSQIHLFDPRYNLSSIQGYIQDNGIDAVAVLYSIPNYIADEYQFVLSR